MAFVQTPRGKFYYEVNGAQGPLIYLLHGLTARTQDWTTTPKALALEGFRVVGLDMRGHGQSDKPEAGYGPEDHAEDIAACSVALGHARFHVVGHSTGGRNGLLFAVMYPERVLSLTIIDQTLTADPDSWKKHLENYKLYPTPFADEAALDAYLLQRFPDKERRRNFEKGQFEAKANGKWDWIFSVSAALETQKLGRAKDLHDLLTQVKCPVLFMKAGDSAYVTPEECALISRLLKPLNFVTIEKAGHGLFRDNPQAFLGQLVPFLRQTGLF
jgi:pimeloyl-ACP methyl ester carboxylesterase